MFMKGHVCTAGVTVSSNEKHLKVHVPQLFGSCRGAGGDVNHLHPNGGPTLGLQDVPRQVLHIEVAHALAVGVLRAQLALAIQASLVPVPPCEAKSGGPREVACSALTAGCLSLLEHPQWQFPF